MQHGDNRLVPVVVENTFVVSSNFDCFFAVCDEASFIQVRVSHFIFLWESRFYGAGVLAKVWDAEMQEFSASHNLSTLSLFQ